MITSISHIVNGKDLAKETIMIGTGELIVIFCVILLLFGGKKLPELARSLGKGIREFKRASQGEAEEDVQSLPPKNDSPDP